MLPTNSTPGLSISDQEKEWKSDTILYYSTWAIRNSFPSENQEYTPFTESINDKDHTCRQKANNNYCQFWKLRSTTVIRNHLSYCNPRKNTCEGILFFVKLQAAILYFLKKEHSSASFFTFCNNSDGSASHIIFNFVVYLNQQHCNSTTIWHFQYKMSLLFQMSYFKRIKTWNMHTVFYEVLFISHNYCMLWSFWTQWHHRN